MNNKVTNKIVMVYYIFVPLLLSTSVCAQINPLRLDVRVDNTTSICEEGEAYRDMILENIKSHMGLYDETASLIDIETGDITTESVEKFKQLFHSNARIFNDLQKYGTTIPMEDYVGLITNRMVKNEPKFKITDMLLQRVESNSAFANELYFEATLKVNKLVYNQIEEKSGKVITIPDGGELIPLTFTIILQGENLTNVTIYGINGMAVSRPKPFNHEVRPFLSYGFDVNTAYTLHKGFSEGIQPELTKNVIFDVGILYSRSFKRGGHASYALGGSYGVHNWTLGMAGAEGQNVYRRSDGAGTQNQLAFNQSYDYRNVENTHRFTYVQGIVGVQLPIRPILGYKLEYWLEVQLLPTWVKKKEEVQLANLDVKILEEVNFKGQVETYCQGDFTASFESLGTTISQFSLGAQVKPSLKYYITDNKSTAFTLGAGYTYFLTSWLPELTTSIHEVDDVNPKSLLLNSFTPRYLRLEAGFIFKLN